jgi:hypothetical protein
MVNKYFEEQVEIPRRCEYNIENDLKKLAVKM